MTNTLMTAQEFVDKWRRSKLKESAGSQSHFNDLCRMLGHPTPAKADPEGASFTFEKGATKRTGGEGWADVWKKGFFAWVHGACWLQDGYTGFARSEGFSREGRKNPRR